MLHRSVPLGAFMIFTLVLSGCSTTTTSAVAGGVGGTVIGAGAGTAIGAASGSMGTGAIVGGAVGLPLGIAAGVLYHDYEEDRLVAERDAAIQANREQIIRTQQVLDSERRAIEGDSRAIDPDRSNGRHLFNGARLGSPF
jgi:hypothetical protein